MKTRRSMMIPMVSALLVSASMSAYAQPQAQPAPQMGWTHRLGVRDIQLPSKRIEDLIPHNGVSRLEVVQEGADSFEIKAGSKPIDHDAIQIIAHELRQLNTTRGMLSQTKSFQKSWDQQYQGKRTIFTFHTHEKKIVITLYKSDKVDGRGTSKTLAHLAEYRNNRLMYAGLIYGISPIVPALNKAVDAAKQHNDANAEYIIGAIKDAQAKRRHSERTLIMSRPN